MAKTIQLSRNGELARFSGSRSTTRFVEGDVRSHATDLRAELGPTGPTLDERTPQSPDRGLPNYPSANYPFLDRRHAD